MVALNVSHYVARFVSKGVTHKYIFFSTVPDGSKTVSTKTNISTEGAISSMAQREVRLTLY